MLDHPNRAKLIEEIAACIERASGTGLQVTRNARLTDPATGKSRELDVHVTGIVGTTRVAVGFECRDRSRPADVTWIEQLNSKRADLRLDKLTAVSTSGFTKEAVLKAKQHSIGLRVLSPIRSLVELRCPARFMQHAFEFQFQPIVQLTVGVQVGPDAFQIQVWNEVPIAATRLRIERAGLPSREMSLADFLEVSSQILMRQRYAAGGTATTADVQLESNLDLDMEVPLPREYYVTVADGRTGVLVAVRVVRSTLLKCHTEQWLGGYRYEMLDRETPDPLGLVEVAALPPHGDSFFTAIAHLPVGSTDWTLTITRQERGPTTRPT